MGLNPPPPHPPEPDPLPPPCGHHKWMPPTSQMVNQSVSQIVNQSVSQSIRLPASQPLARLANQAKRNTKCIVFNSTNQTQYTLHFTDTYICQMQYHKNYHKAYGQ